MLRPMIVRRARSAARRRPGMSIIEMLIALSVLLVIMTSVSLLMRNQTRAVESHAGRMDAGYNARFAVNTIYRELRTAGAGVVNVQPMLVRADSYSITFNADLVTSNPLDPTAVYVDTRADSSRTLVLTKERAITLPRSSYSYPDSTYYLTPGILGRAETMSFWVSADSSTARNDDFILWRRVNDAPSNVVAKGIVLTAGQPLFRYYQRDAAGSLVEIPQNSLPLTHTAPLHGSATDIGLPARIDSIALVRVHVEAVYKDRDQGDVLRTFERVVPVLNTGMVRSTPCGGPPAAVGAVSAVKTNPGQVTLSWLPSADDAAGAQDVERYSIFRRQLASAFWGEPYSSVPAGLSTYSFVDNTPTPGIAWIYAVVAQDCTPSVSTVTQSNSVTP
ncbi:MAG: prepilin-type N-terminal cleavage/methylation domain-containing protein [Gemmatimonadota bacterium]|nr:prepilin-type N-terminal cleavage/methylation domain-containing protein [Gemmatimonadota bacterium]